MELKNKFISQPGFGGDGIGLCSKQEHLIENCIIDLSNCKLSDLDEAIGITWGASATIKRCVIRGAGKLVLCGSGDKDQHSIDEWGKTVHFEDCILRDFGRRGPEVQYGMRVTMNNCLIENWGDPERFTVRNFGAWAHGEGARIDCENTLFMQKSLFTRNFFSDLKGHIGQAVNDGGFGRFFTREAWQPGRCRGLVATDKGQVSAKNCYKNKLWIRIENCESWMDKEEAQELYNKLTNMEKELENGLLF